MQTVPTQTDSAPVSSDELFLVDGSGYIFRAYFALPQTLTNPEGVPVGAVLGFSNMMHKLLTDLHAPSIAVIFDAARKNFRYDLYDQYKANREEAPADLIPQFALIREATEAFGIPGIELEGYEADDLIAAYARLATEQGRKVTIVGTDKDLMQLVNDNVRLYDPIKGRYLSADDVFEKFGVQPDRVIDVQALAGDSADNVPGVPGIGVKTAAQLINEFGTLESLLERAHEIKQPKRREALIEHAENARLSKKLVTLDAHAPVPLSLEDLKARDFNTPRLAAFLNKQGFKTLLTRIGGRPDISNAKASLPERPAPAPDSTTPQIDRIAPDLPHTKDNQYTLITDETVLKQWIARAYETGILAFDTETTGLSPAAANLVGISMSTELGKAAYIPVGHVNAPADLFANSPTVIPAKAGTHTVVETSQTAAGQNVESAVSDNPSYSMDPGLRRDDDIKNQLPLEKVIALLKPVLEDPSVLKIGHNIKYDWQMLHKHGVSIAPVDDTMLLSYILHGTGHGHGHGMDELVLRYCGHQCISFEEVAGKGKNQVTFDRVPISKALQYAAEDAECTLRMHHAFKPRLPLEQVTSIYEDVERPIIPALAKMELTGIRVDPVVLKQMSHDFGAKLAELETDIHALAGHPFNVASPKQLGQVLFGEMGIPGGKKTKTGEWSTAVDVLDDLDGHEIVEKIKEHRQLSKLKSTYTDALQEQINPQTGRVHTSYQMAGTSTGRLSSTDPNLQNIPIRTEEGRKIRTAFVASPGHTLLSVDYSQVELRLAAEMAGVEALKQAFRDKVDIHTLTASQVFDVPVDQVTSDIRRAAKAVNFGIIYGISGWGLSKQLGIPQGDATTYIRKYLARFPEIQVFMEAAKAEAREFGYVKTLYGRKCFIPNINNKMPGVRAGAERQAINAPLQGTAADIMKIAMARMPNALAKANLDAKMLLQVHDELLFEVPEAQIEETAALVKTIMENVAKISVPLEAEAGWGQNWGAAH